MHILEDWRIRDVEQKAERAHSRLWELDSIRSDVGSLERANREICTSVDELRTTVEACLSRIEALERRLEALGPNAGVTGAELAKRPR
jgi:predicted  nucleic acid-binding Zn-ribbon protein